MKQNLLKTWLMLVCLVVGVGTSWADTYEQLTSIGDIDEDADYVLGVDGTGFHKSGTSSWGVCTNSGGGTALTYKLVKALDGNSFKASTVIGSTTYYLTVPTTNTFTMATSSTASNTDLIIGTTQVSGTNYAVANKGTTNRHLRLNGASGLRSYAGVTGTMAHFYKVVPDGPTVSSIAVKTAPTKTSYMVGETFDPTGLVITKTLSNATTEDVTYNNETKNDFSFNPSLETELTDETSVTITYGKKTANQTITVTPFVPAAGTYSINLNNTFFNCAAFTTKPSEFTDATGTAKGVTITYTAASNAYINESQCRIYKDTQLDFTAPAGFEITSIVIGTTTASPSISASTGTFNAGSKTWSGNAVSVKLTGTQSSGNYQVTSVTVTYAASGAPTLTSVAVSGTPTKTVYTEGDEFDPTGLTVMGTYSDASTKEITEGITWSRPAVLTIGQTSVEITATVSAIASPSYVVNGLTVNAIPEKTIAEFIASEGGKCYLTGIVSNITNTTYGNFDLTDESGTISVYGCLTSEGVSKQFASLDVVAGDKIKVLANDYELFNETHEATNVIFVEEIAIVKPKYTVTIVAPENGTLVVKNGETVLASGDQVDEGETLTIECTPTDAENYRYRNWQYKEAGDWVTMKSTMTRVVTQDISIRANFEPIPVYTVAWSVNGTEVKSENLKEGADVTAPADPADVNGKKFQGWVTTPIDGVVNPAPSYATPTATANADVTYYAVFATEVTAPSSDASMLTIDAIKENIMATPMGYSDAARSYDDGKINWTAKGFAQSNESPYIQIRQNAILSYIKIEAPAKITNVSFSVTNGSGANFDGTIYLTTAPTANPGTDANVKGSVKINAKSGEISTISGENSTLYIQSSGAARMYDINVAYGVDGIYSDYCTTVSAPTPANTINFVATDGTSYYATFSSNRAIKFDEAFINEDESCAAEIKAYAVTVVDGEMYLTDQYEVNNDGNYTYIPANTGVLFKYTLSDGTFDGNVPFEYADAEAEYLNAVTDNDLYPASKDKATLADHKFYMLAYASSELDNLGFYYGAADGAAFLSRAGSAYLAVPTSNAAAVRGFAFNGGEATAISEVKSEELRVKNLNYYNLNGQRVNGSVKGIMIVNGKKVLK